MSIMKCPHCGYDQQWMGFNHHVEECKKENPEPKFTLQHMVKRIDELEEEVRILSTYGCNVIHD